MGRVLLFFETFGTERMFSSLLIIIFHLTRPNFIKEGSFQFFFTFYSFHTDILVDDRAFKTGVVGGSCRSAMVLALARPTDP